jgi:mannose-6-phosphate isomerase-like protein (cupin superfamily)
MDHAGVSMKAAFVDIRRRIPGPVTDQWPMGERFALALKHGSMSVEFYAPQGSDPQTPHEQDEVYIVHTGRSQLRLGSNVYSCEAGDVFFVAAGQAHQFENFSEDFATWAIFWGPKGGES